MLPRFLLHIPRREAVKLSMKVVSNGMFVVAPLLEALNGMYLRSDAEELA